jgi:CelD/BcsL family acetyltransferase involved in cellulose biosynthesis
MSNMTNPLIAQAGPLSVPPIVQPTTFQQMRDDGSISRILSCDRNAIRYVPHRGKRLFIDLSLGGFEDYFAKFSGKTRNTIKRKIRRFANRSGGAVDFRIYRSPEEMIEFRRQALTVSLLSYQQKIGFGLPETDEFISHLTEQAANECVCGFVLMERNRPIAYVFCRIDQGIVIYSYCGYDPNFAQLSPGTVLLFFIIKWLFEQKYFKMFDLGNDGWDYKTNFATGAVKYLKVIWFPKTVSNFALVVAHSLVLRAWWGAASVKNAASAWARSAKLSMMRLRPSHPLRAEAGGD